MPVNAKRGVYLPVVETTTKNKYNVPAVAISHISARKAAGKVIFTLEFAIDAAEVTAADQTLDMIKAKCKGTNASDQFSYWGFDSGSTIAGDAGLILTLRPNSDGEDDPVVKATAEFKFVEAKVNGSAG